jgi:hypothetical protein
MHRCQYVTMLVGHRVARGAAACALIAGLTVVALPPVARAEGGAGPAPVATDVALPTLDVATSTAAISDAVDPVGAVSDVLSDVLEESVDEDVDAAAESEGADTETGSAEPSVETPVAAPSSTDTTSLETDTTTDTASGSAATPTAASSSGAVAVQISPTNVNVSIRVESPGDNGPVTQLNVAAATAVGAAIQAPAVQAPAAVPARISSPRSGTAGAAVSPAVAPAISPSTETRKDAGTWTWAWDCLSVPTFAAISPAISTVGTTPTNWTWNWNCPENSMQYHGATASQYQPINVNVGIRLSSPGNDGPVIQANVAVAVSAGSGSGQESAPFPPSSPPPVSPPPTAEAVQALSATGASIAPGLAGLGAPLVSIGDPLEDQLLTPFAITPGFGPVPGSGTPLPLVQVDRRTKPVVAGELSWWERGAMLRPTADPTAMSGAASPTHSRDARPAPRARLPAEVPRERVSAPAGATASAAPGGGSSGGGLPIFLALPFVAAVFDLARRAALGRVAWPSGHRARIPDTPG